MLSVVEADEGSCSTQGIEIGVWSLIPATVYQH